MNMSFETVMLWVVSGVFFFLLIMIVLSLISIFIKHQSRDNNEEEQTNFDESE